MNIQINRKAVQKGGEVLVAIIYYLLRTREDISFQYALAASQNEQRRDEIEMRMKQSFS